MRVVLRSLEGCLALRLVAFVLHRGATELAFSAGSALSASISGGTSSSAFVTSSSFGRPNPLNASLIVNTIQPLFRPSAGGQTFTEAIVVATKVIALT